MNSTYYGLADAHGLESFMKDESYSGSTKLGSRFSSMLFGEEELAKMKKSMQQMLQMMFWRAYHNAQRRSVVYKAIVTPEVEAKVKALMEEGDYEEALLVLKDEATEIGLMRGIPGAEKSWKMIPNKDLDPFA